jgi:hypothetical protein
MFGGFELLGDVTPDTLGRAVRLLELRILGFKTNQLVEQLVEVVVRYLRAVEDVIKVIVTVYFADEKVNSVLGFG